MFKKLYVLKQQTSFVVSVCLLEHCLIGSCRRRFARVQRVHAIAISTFGLFVKNEINVLFSK